MKIFNKIFPGNTLYYPGCLTKFAGKELARRYQKILQAEKIEFITLADQEVCCGSPIKNAGAKKVFKELAEKNLKIFKEHGVTKIISNCPSCTAMFRLDYPKILGKKWEMRVLHISEIIKLSLKNIKSVGKEKKATYHDPCHLGKTLGIYDPPREIIKKAGYQLVEMEFSRQDSFCCGGGGGVKTNYPKLSGKIGVDRIQQAKETGADVLITNCPMCSAQLKKSAGTMKVMELSELFDV